MSTMHQGWRNARYVRIQVATCPNCGVLKAIHPLPGFRCDGTPMRDKRARVALVRGAINGRLPYGWKKRRRQIWFPHGEFQR